MELDDKKFLKRLTEYERKTRDAQFEGMNDNRLDLEMHATELAPIDKGWLKDHITSDKPKWRRDILEATIGANTSYATKVHERMAPALGTPLIRRGEQTIERPGTKYGKAGGKYLQRPLIFGARGYTKHIADRVKAVK